MENKKTGYPHIDKPWMKWYEGDYDASLEPKTNMVEVLKDRNKDGMFKIAYEYYGKQVSYDEMFYNSDVASKVLTQIGVRKGDSILMMTPNIPDEEEIWFGATQIGAICDYIDPRPDNMDINTNARKLLEIIKYEKPRFIVAFDKCYLGMIKPIEKELKEMGINDIVLVNAEDNMDLDAAYQYLLDVANYEKLKNGSINISEKLKLSDVKTSFGALKNMLQDEKMLAEAINSSPLRIHKYQNLVSECRNSKFEKVTDPKLINYIGHTSGTSGARPKPIPLTNENAISSMMQCHIVGVGPKEGDRSLHLLPGFAPFGRYNNDIQTYYNKGTNIHVPEFLFGEFGYLIKKYKPNSFMTPPSFLTSLADCKYLEGEDLSFINKVIYGGDAMTPQDEEKLNKWLKAHNSDAVVAKGHGMSEYCGCGSFAIGDYNKANTIGIPIPGTDYIMIDPDVEDKLVPLKFKEGENKLRGEIAVGGDTNHITNGNFNGEVIVPQYTLDENGKRYIRTGDIGYMDEDGCFFIDERKSRSFARVDGAKIKPSEIEKPIEGNKYVKYAKVVPYYDEIIKGTMPMCHIVLENPASSEEQIDIVEDIVYNTIIANPEMNSRQIPTKFRIREAMPYNKGGKVDFKALEQEGLNGEEINVEIEETNVSVGDIKIFKNNNKQRVRK